MAKKVQTVEIPNLDATDLAILRELQEDARVTITELATRVNLSATPVAERVKRLEGAGIIKQYVAVLDAAKLQRGLMVICYVSLKEHSKKAGGRFLKAIMDLDAVTECLTISGQFDFMLKVVCGNMDAYYDFHVNTLSALDNVGNVQSVFVMGVVKQSYRLV